MLVAAQRFQSEIDYCSKCRSVWLDRGELDKIIKRASQSQTFQSKSKDNVAPSREYQPPRSRESQRLDDSDCRDRDSRKKQKWEGFLGNLFDF